MKYRLLFLIAMVCIFTAVNALAYDGTGKWTYTGRPGSAWDNCDGYTHTAESGTAWVLQTGLSFLIVGGDFSTYGSVNGTNYTFSEKWCQDGGVNTQQTTMTLTSDTVGTGIVSFSWTDGVHSCSGGHQFDLSKETMASPVYDATGKWNFTQSGFWNTCSSPNPKISGYFVVTQTGNKISAIDDEGENYSGYVNGSTYCVFRSFLQSGGRTTDVYEITLGSEITGSGSASFVWDDDCEECGGGWNISVNKDAYTITASSSAGGSISPSGEVTVDGGASQAFQMSPNSGYKIVNVLVDGASVGARTSYTFYNVSSIHTIHAVFQLNPAACESLIFEGFEGGTVPPSGWKLRSTNINTWRLETHLPHTGQYDAGVYYDDKLGQQDELLLSQQLWITEGILHFWSKGSVYWCRDSSDNCDLQVWIVVGEWDAGTGDDILVGKAEDAWSDSWVWSDSSFNLTSLLPGKPIRIGFRYKGVDGADAFIDDIQICSDKPRKATMPFMLLLLE
jgi:hypothetical protein